MFNDPVVGQLVSIPDHGPITINALFLRQGKLPQPNRRQVLISEPFANAHELQPGDQMTAIINGRRQTLDISGIALSPEYIYSLGPGAMFPDDKRFGILWMNRQMLATAYDMDGAFNNVVLTLRDGAKPDDIIEQLDQLLARYGGIGAYARKNQQSHHFLSQEFKGLETMATMFPVIFLGVAAFLLNVVVTRLVNTQREQIAILKAFGYSNITVGLHYLQLVLLITSVGIIIGLILGRKLGLGLGNMYMEFFHFPFLEFTLQTKSIILAFIIGYSAAIIGTLQAVYRAAKLPPAEAMRPEPPASYQQSLIERMGLQRFLDQPTRMILRHISRKPIKTLLTIIGIAMAGAIMMIGNFQEDSINYMLHVQYNLAQQEDLTVTFTEPTARKASYELAQLPGVNISEPFRSVPVRIRFRHHEQRTALQALTGNTQLHRILDHTLQPLNLPRQGVVLNDYLAKLLDVNIGDRVTVEVLSGRRPVLQLQVVDTVSDMLGIPAYIHLDLLNRLLKEGEAINGAFLAIDQNAMDEVYQLLQKRPRVSGVTITQAAVQSARDTMGETILIFTFINTLLAGGIAFGVIYNSARIAYSERSRELASLRVLGFSHGEVAYILLGELTLLTLLAIPIGFVVGRYLCGLIAEQMDSDLYRIPLIIEAQSYAFSATVVLVSALISSLIILKQLLQLDLVAVLKTRD